MPEVGTKTVEYTFTPDEEQYKSYIGNIAINVTKQTPKLEVNTKNAQVMIKSLNKKKSSIVIPDYVTVKRVKCKVVSINKKAVIKVPKKQYNKYKKLFTSKTGFKKPMKLKK